MKSIFDKVKLGNLSLKSRIIRTGLWESQQKDLYSIYDRYDKIASRGVGLISSELFSIYPKDKFAEHSSKMHNHNFMKMAMKISEIYHDYDVPILGQVEFIKYNRGIDLDIPVNDLTIEDIRKIQSDIISSAQMLQYAGFDGIQLSIGNNFYLSKMINPYYNQREDDYGGNLFNRLRLVLELIKVMKDNFLVKYNGERGLVTCMLSTPTFSRSLHAPTLSFASNPSFLSSNVLTLHEMCKSKLSFMTLINSKTNLSLLNRFPP